MVEITDNGFSHIMRVGLISLFGTPLHHCKNGCSEEQRFIIQQHIDEPFCDACERFKDYRRKCPHRGFDDDHILGILYDVVD